ncbi:DoxX family membrane protein [Candidatus Uhrbacteria bacterium]|nr:DoxX family membrane protein [Candidatus Uhrbacteria bacterium]
MSSWSIESQVVLRWSFSFLFAWFGLQQMLHPADWVSFLPEWTGYMPIPGEMLVRLNGWVEFICCIALFIGCYTRVIAAFLAMHLIGIAVTTGGAIGVRDSVLATIGIALTLSKPDEWTLDAKTIKKVIMATTIT